MLIDRTIAELGQFLAHGLTEKANAAFDALDQPRQIVVQRLALHRPALPSEGFPLLSCYRTKLLDSGEWEAKFSWHLQASTRIVEDQQGLLVWAAKTLTELVLEFPQTNPCAIATTAPEIVFGYWLVSTNTTGAISGAYPSIEGRFTFSEVH
jgi:hypothetical protein